MVGATLGSQLREVRKLKDLSLKAAADPARISAAYLQKLERDAVKRPSPHVLFALSEVLNVPYERLMALAGYVIPASGEKNSKSEGVLAYALSGENLSEDEAEVLARYLRWYRNEKVHTKGRADDL